MTNGQFNPFPGLRPFEPDEDHLFFGRERQIDQLVRRLGTTCLLSVVGASAAGKSSLVRCGLIPSLHGGLMTKAGSSWRVAILRPGEDPIGALAAALDAPGVLGLPGELQTTNRVLLEATLRRSTRGLIEAIRLAALPEQDNVLVVIDQFEELFRFRRSGAIPNSRDEAAFFVKLILEAAQQRDVRVHTVLTMRSDFVGDCMEFPGLPEAVSSSLFLVPRLSRDELRLAITGPVQVAGGRIAPRLVTRLLNEVGDDLDQLPVLQHALMRTWDEWQRCATVERAIDLEDYERVGGMANALSLHCDEAYAEAAASTNPELVSRVFKALTDTTSDSHGIRRPTSIESLVEICATTESAVTDVVEAFRRPGRSFLMPPAPTPLSSQSVIDISHESLMRVWKRLVVWAEEERTSTQMYRRVSQASAWFAEGKASLWRDPELELGLQWRAGSHPTIAWAHCDTNFNRAMEFLDRSARERDLLLIQQERTRKRKLYVAWLIAGLFGALSLACFIFARLAGKQSDRADLNLHMAAQGVDMMLRPVIESGKVASPIPEIQGFQRNLLSQANEFYRHFVEQGHTTSQELQSDIASMHVRLGDIHRLNLGSSGEAAIKEYTDAASQFERLAGGHPDNTEYREQEANAYNWLGETQRLQGQTNEAERTFEKALNIQEQLHQSHPADVDYTWELARTYNNRGIVRAMLYKANSAEKDYSKAKELLEPLSRLPHLGDVYRQELDRLYNQLANSLSDLGRTEEAKDFYNRAIKSHEALLDHSPENRDYQLELHQFCVNLADLYRGSGQFDLAEKSWAESDRHLQALARPGPSLDTRIAKSHLMHALILEGQGALALAKREYQESIRILERIDSDKFGSETQAYHQVYGNALDGVAHIYLSKRNWAPAVPLLILATKQNEYKSGQDRAYALAWDYANLAKAQVKQRRFSEAKENLEKMTTFLPELSADVKGQLVAQEKIVTDLISSSKNPVTSTKKKHRQ